MRLLLYIAFIGGFAALGFALSPWLGILGMGLGWATTATILWFSDYGTDGGNTWAFLDHVGGTDLGATGGIFDFGGFDGGGGDCGGDCGGGGD